MSFSETLDENHATGRKTEAVAPDHVEAQLQTKVEDTGLLYDVHGMFLIPQPTDRSDDPLTWGKYHKFSVLLTLSMLAMLGGMSASLINPAFVPEAAFLGISIVEASYTTTIFILAAGVAPIFFAPIANVYGRRPIYLTLTLVAIATNFGSGASQTWVQVVATRVLNGIGASAAPGIGAATVCDLYFLHERGFYMGIYTVFLTNGPHLAPIIGGYIAKNLSWRWCFYIPGIYLSVLYIFILFFLPETLFTRPPNHPVRSYKSLLVPHFSRTVSGHTLRFSHFLRPLKMLRYPAVTFPALYYMTAFGFGSVAFAVSGAQLFKTIYHFDTAQTGLLLGIPLLLGSILGEMTAGGFSDWIVLRDARRHEGERRFEARLQALWPAVLLLPGGLIIFGVCIDKRTHWIGPAMGEGLASFGLQTVTTVCYAYSTDCYKPQSAEVAGILNFARQIFAFTVGFYAIPLGTAIGFDWCWVIFAFIHLFFFIPMLGLMIWGERWRKRMPLPNFDKDL